MSRFAHALLFSLSLFLASCDASGPATGDSPVAGESPGSSGTRSPDAGSSCGQDIGGDAVPPACADPSSSARVPDVDKTLIIGPVGPEMPNNLDHVLEVTVSGDGGLVVDGRSCVATTCSVFFALGSSGRGTVVLSPEPGFHVWNPGTGEAVWPAGPCAGVPGASSCPVTVEADDPAEQSITVAVRADTAEPAPSTDGPVVPAEPSGTPSDPETPPTP